MSERNSGTLLQLSRDATACAGEGWEAPPRTQLAAASSRNCQGEGAGHPVDWIAASTSGPAGGILA